MKVSLCFSNSEASQVIPFTGFDHVKQVPFSTLQVHYYTAAVFITTKIDCLLIILLGHAHLPMALCYAHDIDECADIAV